MDGGFVALLGYVCYHYSGASTVVGTAYPAEKKHEDASKKSIEEIPEPNEATQWLREMAMSYGGFIPGGKSYICRYRSDPEEASEEGG